MHRARLFTGVLASLWIALFVVACQDEPTSPTSLGSEGGLTPAAKGDVPVEPSEATTAAVLAMMDNMNAALDAEGANYRAVMAEYVTEGGSEAGNTVFANNVGNKRLGSDFVPFDARRAAWSGPVGGPDDNITYAVDSFDASNLPLPITEAAIDRAMASWEGEACSNMPITKVPLPAGTDLGVAIPGQPGAIAGDINHSGWPIPFFAPPVLGVAFSFVFCAPCVGPGAPVFTDIDNNGRLDKAFADIFYSPFFLWGINSPPSIDVESVALHEAGHGLSQAHFGKVFLDNNGNLKFAPKAVMNAVYVSPFTVLAGTDNGGHCANWANWPQN